MTVSLSRQGGERRPIQKYGNGGFTIGGVRIAGSVLVLPSGVAPWAVDHVAKLEPGSFKDIAAVIGQFDLCLLGTGPNVARLPRELRAYLKDAGLHVEAMDTGAACRTFNVLAAEGRALVAALIAI